MSTRLRIATSGTQAEAEDIGSGAAPGLVLKAVLSGTSLTVAWGQADTVVQSPYGDLLGELTRSSKTQQGSGLVSLVPGATEVPTDAQRIAGETSLRAGLVWGSSLAATRTQRGRVFTDLDIAALAADLHDVTVATAQPSYDGALSAAKIIPNAVNTVLHYIDTVSAGTIAGDRITINGVFKPSTVITGQSQSLTIWQNSAVVQITLIGAGVQAGQPVAPANMPGSEARAWPRADGWIAFEFKCTATDALGAALILTKDGGGAYAGDGTTGILIDRLQIASVQATAVTNLGASGATITAAAGATCPALEDGFFPENGWPTDKQYAIRFDGLVDRFFVLDANCFNGLSGNARRCRFTWVWHPYQAPQADAMIWSFTGAVEALSIQYTIAGNLKLTRTDDAGLTQTVTFATKPGMVPQRTTVALDGTMARLYVEERLVESQALMLAGNQTFTAGRFGGTISATACEFACDGSALTASDIANEHIALAVRRNLPRRKRLWAMLGQSNAEPNMDARQLAVWGSPAEGLGALHYEGDIGAPNQNALWGPSRLVHLIDRSDVPGYYFGTNAPGTSAQYRCGSEVGFQEQCAPVATMRFAVAGAALTSFLPAGANHAAMIAAFDDASATLGSDFEFAGLIVVGGETDAQLQPTAESYDATALAILGELSLRYNGTDTRLLLYRLHRAFVIGAGYNFAQAVRARCNYLADSRTNCAVAEVDRESMQADRVHLSFGDTQYKLGLRLGEARDRLGG